MGVRKFTCASEGVEDILELPARAAHSVVKKAWFKNAADSQSFCIMSFPIRKQFELFMCCVSSCLYFSFFSSFILFVFFKQCSYLGVTAIGTAVEALQACCPEQQ